MRTALVSAVIASVGLVASGVMLPQKSVVVVYEPNTPDSIVQQAKDAIVAAHLSRKLPAADRPLKRVYGSNALTPRGFAARTTTEVVNSIMAFGAQYNFAVEDDQVVHAVGSKR